MNVVSLNSVLQFDIYYIYLRMQMSVCMYDLKEVIVIK